jgi:hypothetical protein
LPGISEEEAADIVHSELGLGLSPRKIQKVIAKNRIIELRNGGRYCYVSARWLFCVIRELQAAANGVLIPAHYLMMRISSKRPGSQCSTGIGVDYSRRLTARGREVKNEQSA